jgi:hypothetical protein
VLVCVCMCVCVCVCVCVFCVCVCVCVHVRVYVRGVVCGVCLAWGLGFCLCRPALSRRHLVLFHVTKTREFGFERVDSRRHLSREFGFEREVLRLKTDCRDFVPALHLHSKASLRAFVGLFTRYVPLRR